MEKINEDEKVGRITIDPEFSEIVVPLTTKEYEELEKDIVEHGCKTPILTSKGKIIDGHNRYSICVKHGIAYKTEEMEFRSREEAKEWIATNQLARRNLGPYGKYELVTLRAGFERRKEESNKKRLRNLRGQHDLPTIGNSVPDGDHINTQEEIARELGVSKGTVSKMQIIERKFKEGKIADETIDKLRRGEISLNELYNSIKKTEREGPEVKNVETETTERKENLKKYRDTLAGITEWQLSEILSEIQPDDRNELVNQIWTAVRNLKKIGMGLANVKKHTELVNMLSAGELDISGFQLQVQGKKAKMSPSGSKTERGDEG